MIAMKPKTRRRQQKRAEKNVVARTNGMRIHELELFVSRMRDETRDIINKLIVATQTLETVGALLCKNVYDKLTKEEEDALEEFEEQVTTPAVQEEDSV